MQSSGVAGFTLPRPAEPASPALANTSGDAGVGVLEEAGDVEAPGQADKYGVADTIGVADASRLPDESGVADASVEAGMLGEVDSSREEEASVEAARSSGATAGVIEEPETVEASEDVDVLMESPVTGVASAVGVIFGAALAAEKVWGAVMAGAALDTSAPAHANPDSQEDPAM